MLSFETWVVVIALVGNYGSRTVIPVVSHAICKDRCDAVGLIGSAASAFFCGDLVAQIVAKPLVRRFSGQKLLATGCLGWGTLMLLMPPAVHGSQLLLLLVQAFLGLCCGMCYPASHALVAQSVVRRRSTAVSCIQGAAGIGTMFGNFVTPQTAEHLSCLAPFFIFAACGLGCAVLVASLSFGASGSPLTSESGSSPKQTPLGTELLRWFQEPLVSMLIFGMYASGFAYFGLYGSFTPMFFVERYAVKISMLGKLTTGAPLGLAVSCVMSGIIADQLIAKGWQTYRCRMLMHLIGTGVPVVSLLLLAVASSAHTAALLVTLWMIAHGFQAAGVTALLHDIAGPRAGELFVVGNAFAKLAGILAAPVIKEMVRTWGWMSVLQVTALHYLMAGLLLTPLMHRTEQARHLFKQQIGLKES